MEQKGMHFLCVLRIQHEGFCTLLSSGGKQTLGYLILKNLRCFRENVTTK